MAGKKRQVVDLSILSIIKFFIVILALVFFYYVKETLAILFVALVLSAAVDPWVDKLQKYKVPRWTSILLFYLMATGIVVAVVVLLVPPIVAQISDLSVNFPKYTEKVNQIFASVQSFSSEHGLLEDLNSGINALKDYLTSAAGSAFSKIFDIFGGIVSFFIVLVITFYMTVEESSLKRAVTFFLPESYREFSIQLINKIQLKIGAWLKGQLILCLIIGVLSYIGLLILGVDYALILALVAAVGEFIPYLGPVISSVPAIFFAFAQSPVKALFVLVLYIIIQQLENNILAPKIMQKAVGLNPIISIVALLIGAKIGGLVGIILSIPVATALSVVIDELWGSKEQIEEIKETEKE